MVRRAACLALLPFASSALRLGGGSAWDLGSLAAGMQQALDDTVLDAMRDEQGLGQAALVSEDLGRGSVKVNWEISKVENGTTASLFWDKNCDAAGKATGECTFPKKSEGETHSGMHFTLSRPLTEADHLRIHVTMLVRVTLVRKSYAMSAECKLCGEECVVVMPKGDPVRIRPPACPVPPRDIEFNFVQMDFTKVPAMVRVEAGVTTEVVRAATVQAPSTTQATALERQVEAANGTDFGFETTTPAAPAEPLVIPESVVASVYTSTKL